MTVDRIDVIILPLTPSVQFPTEPHGLETLGLFNEWRLIEYTPSQVILETTTNRNTTIKQIHTVQDLPNTFVLT